MPANQLRNPRYMVASFSLLWAVVALGGCRLCQDCGDLDYPTYGGAWERTIRDRGRVGSVFDPAGAQSGKMSDRVVVEEGRKRSPSETDDVEGLNGQAPAEDNPESPSDDQRQNELDKLRDLRLEDINTDTQDFVPPDL